MELPSKGTEAFGLTNASASFMDHTDKVFCDLLDKRERATRSAGRLDLGLGFQYLVSCLSELGSLSISELCRSFASGSWIRRRAGLHIRPNGMLLRPGSLMMVPRLVQSGVGWR
ncbi:uncharacterized protein [Physcomitrium patens]|uniref:uncharacterized protein n=1 Tax=Physcomitrium patens TaxID=3218 RepID=UPI003CCDAB4F